MKKFWIMALLALITSSALAQGPGFNRERNREQIKAARIAFLTSKLQLDTEQAQVFWPLFNEYEAEKGELIKKYNQQKRELVGADGFRNMSDENATKMLDIYLDQKQAELNLEKKYVVQFREVLNPKQTWAMVRFEGEFKRTVLDKMMRRRQEARQQKGKQGNGS